MVLTVLMINGEMSVPHEVIINIINPVIGPGSRVWATLLSLMSGNEHEGAVCAER